jgi:hypothetical protein
VALEDDYRAYREVIAASLGGLRPQAEVAVSGLDTLEAEMARLDPHVVVCSLPAPAGPSEKTLAWVMLSMDPSRPTVVHLDGRCFEWRNPTLEPILGVVDEATRLLSERQLDSRK